MEKFLNGKHKRSMAWLFLSGVSILFYLLWYWHDGVIMSVDGPSYIIMQSDREPGYCSFLWLFRTLFGEAVYLDIVVVIQCVIAGIAAAALALGLQKRFSLHWVWMLFILLSQYGITLLNRFVAQRRYSYYNSICTEALSYSFWIFFFLCLLGVIYDRNMKSVAACLAWSVVLVTIRKHMIITFVLLFLSLVVIWCGEKKFWKAAVFAVCIIIAGGIGARLVDCAYNYAVRGVFEPHTGDSSFIFGNEIYVADEEMVQYISSEENKKIFLEIMRRADEKQYNIAYAQKGWRNLEEHYSASYDRIKFDTVMVVVREYHEQLGIPEEERDARYQQMVNGMVRELLWPCIPGMLRIFGSNVLHGAVTTVLKNHPLLNWVGLFLYLAYAGVFGLLVLKKSYRRVPCSVLPFAAVVMVSVAVNILFTSLTIYCQMRYMLYNTAFFYQAGMLMLVEADTALRRKSCERKAV